MLDKKSCQEQLFDTNVWALYQLKNFSCFSSNHLADFYRKCSYNYSVLVALTWHDMGVIVKDFHSSWRVVTLLSTIVIVDYALDTRLPIIICCR